MVRGLYLTSWQTLKEKLEELDRKIIAGFSKKNVLVAHLSSNDPKKIKDKREFFEKYFHSVGAVNVNFISGDTSEAERETMFSQAEELYLPGGDTKTLFENLRANGLDMRIRYFNGTIVGNSAGVYVLCPEYLKVGRGAPEVIPMFGMLNFWTKAHYTSQFDQELRTLSNGRIIYGMEDGSAIYLDNPGMDGTVHKGKLNFIGNVWKFSEGEKQRV